MLDELLLELEEKMGKTLESTKNQFYILEQVVLMFQ